MRKVHVVVTEDDIKNGKPGVNSNCPIALALKRQLSLPDLEKKPKEGEKSVKVFTVNSDIRTIKNGWEETVETALNPREAIDFIRAFDTYATDKIKPFEFDLEFREL